MMDQARCWAASLDRHGQCRPGELGTHMVAHRPAKDVPGEPVEDHGQVQPTFADWDVGNVSQPDLIGIPATKFRSGRLAATGRESLLSVVHTRERGGT
jgi:hypothetical protein